MSLLIVGSVAYDSVKTPFGQVEEVLGGAATYAGVAASFFTKVRLVACVGRDFLPAHRILLESRGIDLAGLELKEGKTFRWKGSYGYDLADATTHSTELNVFADFRPVIPDGFKESEFVFLANIDPALQRQVLSQVKRPRLVACDTMNYWIDSQFPSLLETLKAVDVLIINEAETRQLAAEANLSRAARKILDWGPGSLVIKRGEYGVLMFTRDGRHGLSVFGTPAYPLEAVFDPTGAGDSFAGGFMGYLAGIGRTDSQAVRQAIVFGSVLASFDVEKFSLDRLKELTFTEIELRFREFRELTQFEEFNPRSITG